jgi:anti-sigma B factor antagonist
MEFHIEKQQDKTVASMKGRLDTVTSAELKAGLDENWTGADDLELDFTEVEYISSAGLRLLVALQKKAVAGGHKMVIRNSNNVVREVFKVAGFNKALTVI